MPVKKAVMYGIMFICGSICSTSGENLFTSCRFHFGADVGKVSDGSDLMNEVDYLTAWAGYGEDFSMGGFFTKCKNNKKTPVIMSYIIAFTARRDKGLQDCNVGTPSLCQEGANYIRQNTPRILSQYVKYAKGAASSFGTADPMVWCIEPDMIQYTYNPDQNGGGLTAAQCGVLVNSILDSVKAYSPNSVFSMDISPWKVTSWQKTWFDAMNMSRFAFINTSGGECKPEQKYIKDTWSPDCPTWDWGLKTYGVPLLADAGYGVGGGGTGYNTNWMNLATLTARINDGVIGVYQANPGGSYASDIKNLRSQLPAPPKCPMPTSITTFKNRPIGATMRMPSSGRLEFIDLAGRVVYRTAASVETGLKAKGFVKRSGTYLVRSAGSNRVIRKEVFVTE